MTLLQAVRELKRAGGYNPFGVRWILGRIHVGTPDAEVAADFEKRGSKWPASAREALVVYALAVHRKNGRLYRRVMRGAIR